MKKNLVYGWWSFESEFRGTGDPTGFMALRSLAIICVDRTVCWYNIDALSRQSQKRTSVQHGLHAYMHSG
jgi:hypothetical protein